MVVATRLLSPTQKIAWLRLIRTDNVGPILFRQLLNRLGSAEAALDALPALARRAGTVPRIPSASEAEDEIANTARLGGELVATGEPRYPALLRQIPAAPPLLTMCGSETLDLAHAVGIVGARNASTAGQRITHLLAGDLGRAGYKIVSGLARGIDAAAHRASLGTGTIAVLAGGIDRIYPTENLGLARQIVESGGLLVSEMRLGWEPRAQDFPRRNRLVSGLSLGIVVVEAARRSGSLITARLALEQNREVFAVPGSPLDPRSEGANYLIREGAQLVTSARDIIEELKAVEQSHAPLLETEWQEPHAEVAAIGEPSVDDRARLQEALSFTPTTISEIVSGTGLSVSTVQILLLELDLAGRIEWSSGQLVALRK